MSRSFRRTAAAFLAAGALLPALAACGNDEGGGSVTVAGITLDAPPERIVSLSPTSTEMLFAIGAGDEVVVVDKYSNYPPEVPKETIDAYTLNVEAVAAADPDLVVLAGADDDILEGLEKLDIPTLVQPAATELKDAYTQLRQLGRLTGHADEAEKVVGEMATEIKEITDEASGAPLSYYYELDDQYYSVTSSTFIGQVLSLLGLTNIADGASTGGNAYPQLSAEYIVEQDPDMVLLADTKCCKQSADTVAARPGWSEMRAVTHDGVVALDDDIASRWGPRLPELLRAVAEAAAHVEPDEAAGAETSAEAGHG